MSQDQAASPRDWRNLLGGSRSPQTTASPSPAAAPSTASTEEPPPELELPIDDSRAYRAFTADRSNRRQGALEIRYASPLAAGIEEGYLLAMPQFVQAQFIGDAFLVIQFSHTVFKIEGRGMRQIVEHLKRGTLQTIQEWNGVRWPEPTASEAKITRIEPITAEHVLELSKRLRTREIAETAGRAP